MKELVWILPILLSVSIVLGGCRARTLKSITIESGKSFGRILIALVITLVVLQIVLRLIPVIA